MISARPSVAALLCISSLYACASARAGHPSLPQPLYDLVAGKIDRGEIFFSGGDGGSFEQAISVGGAGSPREGVTAEYLYLSMTLGQPERDWQRVRQRLVSHDGGIFDIITVRSRDGRERDYYFDAGDYFGQLEEEE